MLKSWLMFRHVGAALKEGRLDEAWQLLKDPALKQYKQGKEYLLQAGIGFMARAKQEAKRLDLKAALRDLARAAEAGVEPANIELVKNEMMDQSLKGVRTALDNGQPAQALTLIETLRQQGVQTSQMATLEEVARTWVMAKDQANRGAFGQAIETLDRVPFRPFPALVNLHGDWQRNKKAFPEKCDALHEAVAQQHWRQVVKLADELLAMAPEHQEVRKARAKAWRALEPPTIVHSSTPDQAKPSKETNGSKEETRESETPRRLLCWVDGVGGYLVCLSPRISLGRATGDASVDVPLFADVSRLHAYLSRDSEGGYVLEAVRPVKVNGKSVEKALLKDGDQLTLGSACHLKFRQPLAVSSTARLDLVSRHRLPLSIDGVLLMADACLFGDNADTHVRVPGLNRPFALVRHQEGVAAQCAGAYQVDGKECKGRTPLTTKSTILVDEARLTLEPLGPRFMGR
jgi:hypothetical protein